MKRFITLFTIVIALVATTACNTYSNDKPREGNIPSKYEVSRWYVDEYCSDCDIYLKSTMIEHCITYEYSKCEHLIDSLSSIDWEHWYSKNNIKKWDDTYRYGSIIEQVKDDLEYYSRYLENKNQYNSQLNTLSYKVDSLEYVMRNKRNSVMQVKYPKQWAKYQEALASTRESINEMVDAYREMYREQRENKYEKPKKYKTSTSFTPYGTVVTFTEK